MPSGKPITKPLKVPQQARLTDWRIWNGSPEQPIADITEAIPPWGAVRWWTYRIQWHGRRHEEQNSKDCADVVSRTSLWPLLGKQWEWQEEEPDGIR